MSRAVPDLKMKPPTRMDIAVMHAQSTHTRECACHLCNAPFRPKDSAEAWAIEKAAIAAGALGRRERLAKRARGGA